MIVANFEMLTSVQVVRKSEKIDYFIQEYTPDIDNWTTQTECALFHLEISNNPFQTVFSCNKKICISFDWIVPIN